MWSDVMCVCGGGGVRCACEGEVVWSDVMCVCGGGGDVCVVWCGVVWCGVVWCGVVWCGVVCVMCVGGGGVRCAVLVGRTVGVMRCVVLCCAVLCCVVECRGVLWSAVE